MAVPVREKRPATYDDLLLLPPNLVGEIIGGDLYASPRPGLPHAVAATALGGQVWPQFNEGGAGRGGWWLVFEPELHLGEDIVVPDLAGWRVDLMPRLAPEPFMTTAPQWICEVLSASTERLDRVKKLAIYAREGVTHAWLVNPMVRTLEVLRLEQGRWVLGSSHEGDAAVRAEPFDAIDLDLSRLWAASPPL